MDDELDQPLCEAAPPEVDLEASAAPSPTTMSDQEMPPALRSFLSEIEQWAKLNERDAKRDTRRFWMLKAPAILSSAFSGILALNHLTIVSAIFAAVTTACVIIDAVNPGGHLRNAHLRAFHDLRSLEHEALSQWRVGSLSGSATAKLTAGILKDAEKVRERIARELRTAETMFAQSGKAR